MNTDTQNFTEDPAGHIRQRADATLTRRLQDPQRLSPGSLVGVLFPVIEKYLAAGLTLEDIATALQEDGFAVKKTHLVRHLGSLRAERGSRTPPPPAAIPAATQPAPVAPAPAATESVATVGAKKEAALVPAPAEPRAEAASPPAPLPEIPVGNLTDVQRSEIVKRWIASQFGDRHPKQIKPDELPAEALAWLERLWGVSAPINEQTGQPYQFMRLTFDGRPMYDNPLFPPQAVPVENGDVGYIIIPNDRAREIIKKYGLRLVASDKYKSSLHIVDKYGRKRGGAILQTDSRTVERTVADIEASIERARASGEQY